MIDDLRTRLQDLAQCRDNASWAIDGRFYTDTGHFARERATLLRQGWHCRGRTDEVPQNGDLFTMQLPGQPLIATRHDGQLRALSNICRHRGMPVAKGRANTERFVCRYYA